MFLPGCDRSGVESSLARQLNVLNLGEDIADFSVSLGSLRWQAIVVIAALVGASVAVAGGISFVGLMVPHFTRVYRADHRHLAVLSSLNGMIVVVVATPSHEIYLHRRKFRGDSFLIAPVFIGLMLKKETSYDA